jgi:tetratricopeptide (TPR) repeat protein
MKTLSRNGGGLRGVLILLVVALALATGCARSPEAKKARFLERGDRYFKQAQYREAVIEYRNALRIDGNNAQAIRQLALAHYQLGELAQSFRFLLKAQELEPDNPEIPLKLATVYLLGRKPDEARTQADRVLQKEPRNLDALIILAGAATTPSEVDAAIQRLEAVRAEVKNQARFHLTLANLYARKGNQAAVEPELRAALAAEPNSPEAHLALAGFYVGKRATAEAEQEFKNAASLAPPGSLAQLQLADYYLSVGRADESKRVLTEITIKAPDFLPAWRRLGEIALAEGRLDDAAKAVDAVLKKAPGDLDGHILLGRVHLARRQSAPAIQEFRTALKAEPRFAPAHYQLGLALLQAGDVQQAKAELKEAISIAPNFGDAILALARVNLQTGAVQPVIDDLERLLASQPKLVSAQVLLALAYLSQKRPAQAAEVARKVVASAPQDPRGPDILGVSLAGQGKRDEASRAFENSLALAPAYLDPLTHLIALAVADKRWDWAIDRTQKQIALAPKSGVHQALLGDLYAARGNSKLAEEAYLKAIDLDPQLFGAYFELSNLYLRARQYDQALAKTNELIKANPTNPAPLMLSGIVYELKADIPNARSAYERALALNPRFAAAANNLAWIYSEYGGDKDKALQLAQTAKEQAPEDPRISDTLGWIMYKRGVYQRALALLKESADKLPNNPQVQYHLGMAYQQVGDRDNARKALELAVTSSESFIGKDEARKALAAVR